MTALATAVPPARVSGAERAQASLDCAAAQHELVYDCRVKLVGKKSGQPLAEATVVVGADMPSMPMAHKAMPVAAQSAGKAGMFDARIELQIPGEWALKLDISGPTRNRAIHKIHFGEAESGHGRRMSLGRSSRPRPVEMEHGTSALSHGAAR